MAMIWMQIAVLTRLKEEVREQSEDRTPPEHRINAHRPRALWVLLRIQKNPSFKCKIHHFKCKIRRRASHDAMGDGPPTVNYY